MYYLVPDFFVNTMKRLDANALVHWMRGFEAVVAEKAVINIIISTENYGSTDEFT